MSESSDNDNVQLEYSAKAWLPGKRRDDLVHILEFRIEGLAAGSTLGDAVRHVNTAKQARYCALAELEEQARFWGCQAAVNFKLDIGKGPNGGTLCVVTGSLVKFR